MIITSPGSPQEAFSWINKNGETEEWDRQEQLIRRLTWEDELQVYEFPLWDDVQTRLMETVERFTRANRTDEAMVEEEFSMSPILPEPTQIDEA